MDQQAMQDSVQEYKVFEAHPESRAFRHTSSHILAQAVKRLFPEAKLGIGPAIDYGFYYDFDLEHRFTEEDLAAIEKEMKKITKANIPLERFELPREEAIKFMQEKGEPYKVELIKDLAEDEVTLSISKEIYRPLRGTAQGFNRRHKSHQAYKRGRSYWRETKRIRCSKEFTAPHSQSSRCWMNISICSRKLRREIIARSERKWTSLPSWKRGPDSPSSSPKA